MARRLEIPGGRLLSKCEWRKRLEPPATAARAEALWPSQADGRSAGQWPLRREAPPPTGSASSRKVSLVSSLFTLAANTCMVAWAAVSFSPFPLFCPFCPRWPAQARRRASLRCWRGSPERRATDQWCEKWFRSAHWQAGEMGRLSSGTRHGYLF